MNQIIAGQVIDGYELIRVIGQGGFGTVWLAKSKMLNSYVALKVIAQQHGVGNQRELTAVQAYKKLALGGYGSGLMPIEHVGLFERQVFYVMPLSDEIDGRSPAGWEWKPLTLSARIAQHIERKTWFTSQEIVALFTDICKAAQTLSDAGLVHRDIKPDNILFFRGRAVISDVSLLTDDAFQGTRYGTPGFSAPSWYVETGGKIDMYSIAATLFTTLTGQSPDKMGRAAFQWPPVGKDSLSDAQQAEWKRLHRVVMRATNEKSAERYIEFNALSIGLNGDAVVGSADVKQASISSVASTSRKTGMINGLGRWFFGLFPPMRPAVLVGVIFLVSVLFYLFVFKPLGLFGCFLVSVFSWYLFFRGLAALRSDWRTDSNIVWGRVFCVVWISLVFFGTVVVPSIEASQSVVVQNEEGWGPWRHFSDVHQMDDGRLEYTVLGSFLFLFLPLYAAVSWPLRYFKKTAAGR